MDIEQVVNDEIVMQHNRRYYAFRCEIVRENMRPAGKKQRGGCGLWSVKASKYEMDNKHLQANCPCGRRARLNSKTRRFFMYDTREAAELHCSEENRSGDEE